MTSRIDVDGFRRTGYVVVPGIVDVAGLAQLRAEADRLLELAICSSLVARVRHPRLDAVVYGNARLMIRTLQPVNDLSEDMAALSTSTGLLGPMRELMGDEPVLMEEKLNYKQLVSLDGHDTGFLDERDGVIDGFAPHHDWGYYRLHGYPSDTLSSAIALDDCAGRGPIRVVPGSHLLDVPLLHEDAESGNGIVADGLYADADMVPIELEAGSAMLFHARLVHDSEPNRSGRPRRLMIYSHYPRSHDPDGDPDRRNSARRAEAQRFEHAYAAAGSPRPWTIAG